MTPRGQNSTPALAGHPVPSLAEKTRATVEGGSKKGRFYKALPKEFRRDRFNYRQIVREGDLAIFEQSWSGCADPSTAYEVGRVRRREGFKIGVNFFELAELYPPSKAWGADGFPLINRDAAFEKLRELADRNRKAGS